MHPDFSHLIKTFQNSLSLNPNMCFLPCTVPCHVYHLIWEQSVKSGKFVHFLSSSSSLLLHIVCAERGHQHLFQNFHDHSPCHSIAH